MFLSTEKSSSKARHFYKSSGFEEDYAFLRGSEHDLLSEPRVVIYG